MLPLRPAGISPVFPVFLHVEPKSGLKSSGISGILIERTFKMKRKAATQR
jgi:hypothetical protein